MNINIKDFKSRTVTSPGYEYKCFMDHRGFNMFDVMQNDSYVWSISQFQGGTPYDKEEYYYVLKEPVISSLRDSLDKDGVLHRNIHHVNSNSDMDIDRRFYWNIVSDLKNYERLNNREDFISRLNFTNKEE